MRFGCFVLFTITVIESIFAARLYTTPGMKESTNCTICYNGITEIRESLKMELNKDKVYHLLATWCSNFLSKSYCENGFKYYGNLVINTGINRLLDPDILCPVLTICQNKIKYITLESYAERVWKDKPEKKKQEIKSESSLKFIQLSDIHFDADYKEDSIVNCGEMLCCHTVPDKPMKSNNYTLSGLFGASGSCDSGPALLDEIVDKISEITPDFILWTGDNVGHKFEITDKEVINASTIISTKINAKLGMDIPIYPALGNHENSPADQFNGINSEGINGIADAFKSSLTEEAYQMFRKYGYYSQLHKNTSWRIVAINTLMCESLYFKLLSDTSEPKEMFDWLESVLTAAEINGESVYLLNHIPNVNGELTKQCAYRLKIWCDRYQNIIRGYFSGHYHTEEISIIHEYNTTVPNIVNYIASGVTPNGGNNPSFRVYLADSLSLVIKDFTQFRLDLIKSNAERKGNWFVSYKATDLFSVNNWGDIDALSKINVEGDYIVKKYWDLAKGGNLAHDARTIIIANCTLHSDNYDDFAKCQNKKPGVNIEYIEYLINLLIGNWRE